MRNEIDRQIDAVLSLQVEHRERFLDDREFLAEAAFFKPSLPQNKVAPAEDVGAKLNPLLFWVPTPEEESERYGRQLPLVAKPTLEFLLRYQSDWIKSRSFVKRLTADLGFLDVVDGHTVWDIETAPPLVAIAEKRDFLLPTGFPLPETLDLISAIKVRLIKGSADFSPIDALKNARQLAGLLLSTENFQLVSTGLTVLDVERRAYREYVDRGWIAASQWTPVDRNATMRAIRAMKATRGYLRLATPPERLKEIALAETVPPAFCAAVNEQLPVEFALEDELTGTWPLERTYRDSFSVLHEIAARAMRVCRLKVFRALYKEGVYREGGPEGTWPLPSLPYFRTIFALRDWTSMSNHFEGYAPNSHRN